MFKRKTFENKKCVSSNDFTQLISDSLYINKNISKLDFIGGVMISKSSLKGVVYISNVQPSLSEIDDVNSILNRIDLVNMLYLFTDSDKAEVYQSKYDSHVVTDSYIEINLKGGQTKRLNY
ncbi:MULTISPECIES: hypothetical protein [Bacillus]|uniref:hypothetical protein n=1 Tax=Bacillus TaxID=1386 RepID=UPI0030FAA8D6